MLYQSVVNSKVTQLYPYTHSFSIMVYPGRLDVAPCAEQRDLVVYPF